MKPTLTLTFDSIEEMQDFLARSTALPAVPDVPAKVPSGAPAADPVPTADVIEMPAPAAAPEPAAQIQTEDAEAHRARLMGMLREKAQGMEDGGAALGKFINAFGVAKFSDLEDHQLPGFEAALQAEFG